MDVVLDCGQEACDAMPEDPLPDPPKGRRKLRLFLLHHALHLYDRLYPYAEHIWLRATNSGTSA